MCGRGGNSSPRACISVREEGRAVASSSAGPARAHGQVGGASAVHTCMWVAVDMLFAESRWHSSHRGL